MNTYVIETHTGTVEVVKGNTFVITGDYVSIRSETGADIAVFFRPASVLVNPKEQ